MNRGTPIGVKENIRTIRHWLDALPRLAPPADAFVQDFIDTTSVPAGAPTTWVTVRQFVVPAQKRSVVKRMAIDGNSPVAPVFLRFRWTINGTTAQNYQAPPYIFGTVANPAEIYLDVDQQNTIELQLKNLDPVIGYQAITRFVLWTYDILWR